MTSDPEPIALDILNRVDDTSFTVAMNGVFEHAPWVVEAAAGHRPFASLADLYTTLTGIVRDAPLEQRLTLVRGHPDLAGKAARAGDLTSDSSAEQASAVSSSACGVFSSRRAKLARIDSLPCRRTQTMNGKPNLA